MLKSAPRVVDGRCAEPQETLTRLIDGLSGFSPRYTGHAVGDALFWGSVEVDALEFPPMGKGSTSLACQISTYAETAEWLALQRRRELAQPKSDHALPITSLLNHIATVGPELLAEIESSSLARHWVPGWSLSENREISVPLEYVHAISGTNGLAAGNCLEEAVVQGLNEVFERRTAITFIKNRMVLPTIDPESIEDADLRQQLEDISALGVQCTIKDLSFGDVLPCIGVYFSDPNVPTAYQSHHAFKVAGSFDRRQALSSCLTEYVQLRRTNESGSASYEKMTCTDETDNFLPLFWFGYVPYADASFVAEGDVVPFNPGACYADCLDDIAQFQSILQQLGLDVIMVDLTDPVVDFPVVQVVIPGYSDILPYHPASSPVLTKGWTRDLPMGYSSGSPVTAEGMFPNW